MSVNVKLIDGVSSLPDSAGPSGWTLVRKDEGGATYEYEIFSGGALAIWRQGQEDPEVVYGPEAWLKVSGKQRGAERSDIPTIA